MPEHADQPGRPGRPAEAERAAPPRFAPLPRTGDPSTDVALALLATAVAAGVCDVVVCPGSRSQALALVAAELERVGAIRLHVRHDERSAAFFALGVARETGRPVPVVVTSGTAVANLHPAMLEAHHAGVPLVALTGDRPPELVGVGANQATLQPGMLGPLIDIAHLEAGDVEGAAALGARIATTRTALHANVAFRDPLSVAIPDLAGWMSAQGGGDPASACAGAATLAAARPELAPEQSPRPVLVPLDATPTLVLAGADSGPEAEALAHAGGWPLIAEVSSGARFGRNLVVPARELLEPASPAPELRDGVRRVIVLGHPTLSRELPRLMARADVETIVVDGAGERVGSDEQVARRGDRVALVGAPDDAVAARRAWLRSWLAASREILERDAAEAPAPDVDAARSAERAERAAFARGELAVSREPVDRAMLVDAVWRATWPHDRLVLGASRLIRVLDARAPGRPIRVHANRGLAGIDGTIATGLGVAAASQGGDDPRAALGVTRILLGDTAFIHDASSLLVAQGGETAPRVQLIVGTDGGGTIFDGLEVAATAGDAFDRVLFAPLASDLGAIARAYGWEHVVAGSRGDLERALTDRGSDRVVIEVPLPRDGARAVPPAE